MYRCLAQCAPGQVPNSSQEECEPCTNNCVTCADGRYLKATNPNNPSERTCVDDCGQGYGVLLIGNQRTCSKCDLDQY